MVNWENVASYYDDLGKDKPSLRTLAQWLRAQRSRLGNCRAMISHGVLHIYKEGRPDVCVRVWNCAVKEYLEASFISRWKIGEVTHERIESVHAVHSAISPCLDQFLDRLCYETDGRT